MVEENDTACDVAFSGTIFLYLLLAYAEISDAFLESWDKTEQDSIILEANIEFQNQTFALTWT